MAPPSVIQIEEWLPGRSDSDIDALADILHSVVHSGAGVSFVVPFSVGEARAFWVEKVLPEVANRKRRLLTAKLDGKIVGTVHIYLDMPPNQQHRADITKLLVHPDGRRRGIARSLMEEIEKVAIDERRTMLMLDTWTGSPAEALYVSMGYVIAGVVPKFARTSTSEELEPTTIMYKELSADGA